MRLHSPKDPSVEDAPALVLLAAGVGIGLSIFATALALGALSGFFLESSAEPPIYATQTAIVTPAPTSTPPRFNGYSN